MNSRIIYPQANGTMAIVVPSANCGLTVEEIAKKDVPPNTPYLIVDVSVIPTDREFRNAWEADFSKPDGYGIGHDAWFAEQAKKEEGAE